MAATTFRSVIAMIGFVALSAPPAAGGEIRVLYWFDRSRPLDTFKFQAYDLRKNEFTPDVERWSSATKARFPGYEVYTRDVVLSRERGETEKLKIGSAITREFLLLGHRYGYSFGPAPGAPAGGIEAPRPSALRPIVRPVPQPFRPSTPTAPAPFPLPYPRPHP